MKIYEVYAIHFVMIRGFFDMASNIGKSRVFLEVFEASYITPRAPCVFGGLKPKVTGLIGISLYFQKNNFFIFLKFKF